MIDHLSTFVKKFVWLKPLFFITTATAVIVFGYVVLIGNGADKDVYIIPSIVGVLWSLVCLLLLSVFPYVPPKPGKHQHFFKAFKNPACPGLLSFRIIGFLHTKCVNCMAYNKINKCLACRLLSMMAS